VAIALTAGATGRPSDVSAICTPQGGRAAAARSRAAATRATQGPTHSPSNARWLGVLWLGMTRSPAHLGPEIVGFGCYHRRKEQAGNAKGHRVACNTRETQAVHN